MLSKNNFNEKLRRANQKKDHFSIRKLTVGVASVLIGLTFIGVNSQVAHAADADQPAQTEEVAKKAEDTASDQVKEDTTHAPAKAANDVNTFLSMPIWEAVFNRIKRLFFPRSGNFIFHVSRWNFIELRFTQIM